MYFDTDEIKKQLLFQTHLLFLCTLFRNVTKQIRQLANMSTKCYCCKQNVERVNECQGCRHLVCKRCERDEELCMVCAIGTDPTMSTDTSLSLDGCCIWRYKFVHGRRLLRLYLHRGTAMAGRAEEALENLDGEHLEHLGYKYKSDQAKHIALEFLSDGTKMTIEFEKSFDDLLHDTDAT